MVRVIGDTGLMTVHAAFYGGPADGGELLLREPVRVSFRFPLTTDAAAALLAPRQDVKGGAAWVNLVPVDPPSEYRVDLDANDRLVRDRHNRVRLVHVPPKTQHPTPPKETHTDD